MGGAATSLRPTVDGIPAELKEDYQKPGLFKNILYNKII